MRLFKLSVYILVPVALILAVLLTVLPGSYAIQRRMVIDAPAPAVFSRIDSPQGWQKWSVWFRRDPAMKIEFTGPAAGAGAGWRWQSRVEGNGSMVLSQIDAPHKLSYQLQFGKNPTPMYGSISLQASQARTTVIWEIHGDAGTNWAMKLFLPFMDTMLGKDLEDSLKLLKQQSQDASAAPVKQAT